MVWRFKWQLLLLVENAAFCFRGGRVFYFEARLTISALFILSTGPEDCIL